MTGEEQTRRFDSISVPTMLLDEARARRNIARMAAKARKSGVRFRPHFKTHQSAQIGEWFRDEGVQAITVSSVRMAAYFAAHGWQDITIAFPTNVREIAAINRLAAQVRLHLLVESVATVACLAERLTAPVAIWIEADTGYWRSGVRYDDAPALRGLADRIVASDRLTLQGLLTHAGQTYGAPTPDAIAVLYRETVARLEGMRAWLKEDGFPSLEISIGDTPACSVLDDLGAVDEMRPGNFVFYDLMQMQIGACAADDVALVVACPVVAQYPARGEVILYGGAVHLSKDFLTRPDGTPSYGQLVKLTATGWSAPIEGAWLRSLSQEHGIVRAEPDVYATTLAHVAVGDLLGVIPVHSCLTADLLKQYTTLDGSLIHMAPIPC